MASATKPFQIGYLRIGSNKRAEQEEMFGRRRPSGEQLTRPFHFTWTGEVKEGAPKALYGPNKLLASITYLSRQDL